MKDTNTYREKWEITKTLSTTAFGGEIGKH